jgi:CRISPR-associated protein Csx14
MKNILLAVSGLTPQVITETLYALHQDQRKVDAIHVITTRNGKEKIYSGLLGGKSGAYYQYLKEFDINPASIDFSHGNIHVLTDADGNEIDDIVDEADNERLLKKCLELTFHLTKNPETAVFFSIAGGRKTMSSCLALAAQMYGRPQDRVFHVLISPEFESCRDFYYPPKISKEIELRDSLGQPYRKNTEFARINLIHIPFVTIRNQLSTDMLKSPKDPATLMMSLVKEDPKNLSLNLLLKKLVYKKMEYDIMPAHLALYAFFAMQKKNCEKEGDVCGACTACFLEITAVLAKQPEITGLYKRVCGSRPTDEMGEGGIIDLDDKNFNSYKSKINRQLRKRFGAFAVKDLEIASIGKRPDTRYGIRMDKSMIEMVI